MSIYFNLNESVKHKYLSIKKVGVKIGWRKEFAAISTFMPRWRIIRDATVSYLKEYDMMFCLRHLLNILARSEPRYQADDKNHRMG